MPKNYASGIEVRLCTTAISESSSRTVQVLLPRQGSEEIERIENALESARLLSERIIKEDNEEDGVVRFVDGRPFYLVRTVRRELTPNEHDLSAVLLSEILPKGLVVRVNIPLEARRRGLDKKLTDVKSEVYYNGQFACTKLSVADPRRYISQHHLSGQRVHMSFERPWVEDLPKKADWNNDLERREACQTRWDLVNQAIETEAMNSGVDEKGRPLPITDYLTSLAHETLPNALLDDTAPTVAPNMGLIDVIISIGKNNRPRSTNYVSSAERFPDPRKRLRGMQDQLAPSHQGESDCVEKTTGIASTNLAPVTAHTVQTPANQGSLLEDEKAKPKIRLNFKKAKQSPSNDSATVASDKPASTPATPHAIQMPQVQGSPGNGRAKPTITLNFNKARSRQSSLAPKVSSPSDKADLLPSSHLTTAFGPTTAPLHNTSTSAPHKPDLPKTSSDNLCGQSQYAPNTDVPRNAGPIPFETSSPLPNIPQGQKRKRSSSAERKRSPSPNAQPKTRNPEAII